MGGQARFVDKLDGVFDAKAAPAHFKHVEDITSLLGGYAPTATSPAITGRICTTMPARCRSAGNACGRSWTASTPRGRTAWPATMTSSLSGFGRPFLAKTVLHLAGDKTFTITAAPFDALHPCVGEITLRGREKIARLLRASPNARAGGALRAHPGHWAHQTPRICPQRILSRTRGGALAAALEFFPAAERPAPHAAFSALPRPGGRGRTVLAHDRRACARRDAGFAGPMVVLGIRGAGGCGRPRATRRALAAAASRYARMPHCVGPGTPLRCP